MSFARQSTMSYRRSVPGVASGKSIEPYRRREGSVQVDSQVDCLSCAIQDVRSLSAWCRGMQEQHSGGDHRWTSVPTFARAKFRRPAMFSCAAPAWVQAISQVTGPRFVLIRIRTFPCLFLHGSVSLVLPAHHPMITIRKRLRTYGHYVSAS